VIKGDYFFTALNTRNPIPNKANVLCTLTPPSQFGLLMSNKPSIKKKFNFEKIITIIVKNVIVIDFFA
jgi:hypothetical protein